MEQQTVTLAANIRAEMARRGLSQSALADAIGVSQPSLSKRLGGSVPWTFAEVAAIAALFDVPLGALTGEAAA